MYIFLTSKPVVTVTVFRCVFRLFRWSAKLNRNELTPCDETSNRKWNIKVDEAGPVSREGQDHWYLK